MFECDSQRTSRVEGGGKMFQEAQRQKRSAQFLLRENFSGR